MKRYGFDQFLWIEGVDLKFLHVRRDRERKASEYGHEYIRKGMHIISMADVMARNVYLSINM